jgi:hypothetical protein
VALGKRKRVEIAALALLLHLLLCCCAGGGQGWTAARAVLVAEWCADAMAASMGALRGGMHDREEDIEAFTAKQLALVELECEAEEAAATEEQQSFTLKQLEVRTRAPGGSIPRFKPGRPALLGVCLCVTGPRPAKRNGDSPAGRTH